VNITMRKQKEQRQMEDGRGGERAAVDIGQTGQAAEPPLYSKRISRHYARSG